MNPVRTNNISRKSVGSIINHQSIQTLWQVWMGLSLVGKLWLHLLFDDFISNLIALMLS